MATINLNSGAQFLAATTNLKKNMHDKPQEADWKAFRRMVPELRERYLGQRNLELMALLKEDSKTPTEKFWEVKGLSDQEAKTLRVCLDGHTRSKMFGFILLMLQHRMMTFGDLDVFSEGLRERAQVSLDGN